MQFSPATLAAISLTHWREYFETVRAQRSWNHAYVVSGPTGVGKRELAFWLIKQVLCVGDNDGLCISCRAWIRDDQGKPWHPDMIVLQPIEGDDGVKIEVVRSFLQEISLAPSVSTRRVAIVPDLALLNVQGYNALLKTLEEPPPHLIFIGVVENFMTLPATVRSRVHHCAMAPVNPRDLSTTLMKSYSRDDSIGMAYLSYGRIELAQKFLSDVKYRKQYLSEAQSLVGYLENGLTKALEDVDNIIKKYDSKSQLIQLLDHWHLLLRDIVLIRNGLTERVGHREYLTQLEKLAERGTLKQWINVLDYSVELKQNLAQNGNKRLQLGKFFLSLPYG